MLLKSSYWFLTLAYIFISMLRRRTAQWLEIGHDVLLNNCPLSLNDLPAVSQSWGYDHIDKRGEEVENWQDDHKLNLIDKPEDQQTFYSRQWRTTSTPDLAFCTDDLDGRINREVREQLGGSDHRPVLLTMSTYISCESTLPRWNYKKADWTLYSQLTDQVTNDIRVEDRDIN